MDARQLAILREVAERGSVTEAARVLHCTPSAVSQQVKALESHVGTALLERVGRGIRVTPAGSELARSAVEVAIALERAESACAQFAERPTGTVRVAAFQSAAQMLLPGLLTALTDTAGIVVECGEQDVPQSDFVPLTGEYDVVIAHRPNRRDSWASPAGTAGIKVVSLLREPLDVALPRDHPLAAREVLTPRDLIGQSWITVRESFPVAGVLDAIAVRAGEPLRVAHRINDFHVIEAMVSAGHGIALLPRYTADHRGGRRFALRPLAQVRASREIDALLRPDRAERLIVQRVLAELRSVSRAVVAQHSG